MVINPVYSISQIRQLEKQSIESGKLSENCLMLQAGAAAFELLQATWPQANYITVFCGPGNNGGDGFVLANLAYLAGLNVTIVLVSGSKENYSVAAATALFACRQHDIPIVLFTQMDNHTEKEILVDAILGIGLTRPVEGVYKEAIEWLNAASLPVLSLDVPSGLSAETGCVMNEAVRASMTLTFIGYKQGLFTQDGPDYCGHLQLATLNLPKEITAKLTPAGWQLLPDYLHANLNPRPKNCNKGEFGHLLIIGGYHGMAGAVRLAGEAALRVGAGLVSIAAYPSQEAIVCAKQPELMCHSIENQEQLTPLLKRATAIILGPGLGQSAWGKALKKTALAANLPTVIDADGLNLLGKQPVCQDNWVLTPHPGEAARLLGIENANYVQINRFAALEKLCELGGVWVLKGNGSLIKKQGSPYSICSYGNPGMASGGMGDVLSGIIGGLIAQRIDCFTAASLGVLMHALAGDKAATAGERGLLASDLIAEIRPFAN